MCGNVGVVGDLFQNDKKAFDLMLRMDTVRGPHSTGVARVMNHNRQDVKIVKDVGTPWDLARNHGNDYYNSEKTRDVIVGDIVALMGHNRWATVGEVVQKNAHPFEAGKIVGMQNGTLPEYDRKKLADWEAYGTDTEALMVNIDRKGVENVIPTIMGAWALVWYNKDEDTFNILRNKERPLFFAWKKGGKVLYYASEAWMIYAATEKCGVDLENELVYHVEADVHYQYKLGVINKFGKQNLTKTPLEGWKWHKGVANSYKPANSSTNSAKDSANVFTQGAAQTVTGTTASPSETDIFNFWVGKKDQYFEFTISGDIAKDEQGQNYIKGRLVNGGPEARLYSSVKDPDLKALLGDPDALTFAGKIKKVKSVRDIRNGRDNVYVTFDTNTVLISQYRKKNTALGELFDINVNAANNQKIINPMDGIDQKIVVNGKETTFEDYSKKVDKGCAWCTYVPEVGDCTHLTWLDAEEFLCKECSSNEDVTQYVKQYVKG